MATEYVGQPSGSKAPGADKHALLDPLGIQKQGGLAQNVYWIHVLQFVINLAEKPKTVGRTTEMIKQHTWLWVSAQIWYLLMTLLSHMSSSIISLNKIGQPGTLPDVSSLQCDTDKNRSLWMYTPELIFSISHLT